MFAIIIGWVLSFILTETGVITKGSPARTDYRSEVLVHAEWFRVPYPGNILQLFDWSNIITIISLVKYHYSYFIGQVSLQLFHWSNIFQLFHCH